jgi:hypothetical protein
MITKGAEAQQQTKNVTANSMKTNQLMASTCNE